MISRNYNIEPWAYAIYENNYTWISTDTMAAEHHQKINFSVNRSDDCDNSLILGYNYSRMNKTILTVSIILNRSKNVECWLCSWFPQVTEPWTDKTHSSAIYEKLFPRKCKEVTRNLSYLIRPVTEPRLVSTGIILTLRVWAAITNY